MKGRVAQLDFLKGIAIILVVTGHVVSQIWAPYSYEQNIVFRFCYSFHMPLFVFISGYICSKTLKKDIGWLLRRLRNIGIPYIIMLILSVSVLGRDVFSDIIHSLPYWYLPFILITDSVLYIDRKYRLGYTPFAALYTAAVLIHINAAATVNIADQMMSFLPFYVLGTVIAEKRDRISAPNMPLTIMSVLFIVLTPLYAHGTENQLLRIEEITGIDAAGNRLLKAAIIMISKFAVPLCGIAFVCLLTDMIYCTRSGGAAKKLVEYIGKHTLFIYLLHDLFFVDTSGLRTADTLLSLILGIFIPVCLSSIYYKAKKSFKEKMSKTTQ